ncbi:error-prone DNA polymerase [Pedobacter namyangjuensis]|uniref:error-prone DNA polymerase n=1 Tax=Pedobacter namyangjuensis TaxID=600626 RepID=UPI000DE4A5CA|nr:error-prone DNA polymerase [Pedobacter namyangjuensis]
MLYAELQTTSNFSFLRGASHPEELMKQAALLGYHKIAVTDRNTLAGIVRAHAEAKKHHIKFIPACRLDLLDGPSLLAYPINKNGYCNLSALLSLGNSRAEKGQCHINQQDVWEHKTDLIFIAIAPSQLNENYHFDDEFKTYLKTYKKQLGKQLYLAICKSYTGADQKKMYRLAQLAKQLDIKLVATNDVHYHESQRRQLQDVLTCVREKCTIHNAGFRLHENAERHLKTGEEMHRLFMQYPEAIEEAINIANACTFSLDELEYVYPDELTTDGRTPQEELKHLAWEGARKKFGEPVPSKIIYTLNYELDFVERKNYASYFLTVHDFVRFARSKDILCQGRGSAANSVICFCLGITSVDPTKFKLLFARFMSDARNEPPDIDVDFEHERREEVMQYIFSKYGRDRAAIVATVTQLHSKGAVRDVGKAMGLSVDTINLLSNTVGHYFEEGFDRERLIANGLNPDNPLLRQTLNLTAQMVGFPRQLGQHTGGFVITQGKLSDLCPTLNARMENRTCIEWNKDDIEALGFMKVDVLALGMLTCIKKAFNLAKEHYQLDLTLDNIPQKDEVYDMICEADTLGVFQIESRAQMSMLPRLKPRKFYDLVIEVAIVRPGPIQGNMVHPYLRRREEKENVVYPSKELEQILEKTKGVPLFQEQAMEVAIVAAGFTDADADGLRRSMASFKAKGKVSEYERKLIDGMLAKGYDEGFARQIFRQLEGFGSYGFPESHAASFALLVYVSSWLKCFHPDIFATALLNSLPMGFYQPAQIVIDAQKHGVEVLPIDVNHSMWDNVFEGKKGKYYTIRLGFRQAKGLVQEDINKLVNYRKPTFTSLTQLRDAGIQQSTIEKLADADAFRSMGMDRREALWQASALNDRPIALFKDKVADNSAHEAQISLPFLPTSAHVLQDYANVGLSLKAHPVSFVRAELNLLKITSNQQVNEAKNGESIKVAGLILVRQRPGTASGVCFITLEDETGITNLVVYGTLFKKYRKEILGSKLLMAEGKVQREGKVVHVVVERCYNYNKLLQQLNGVKARNIPPTMDEKVFHDGRNFK